MEMRELKEMANLHNSKNGREVYNYIIGVYFPGGNEILDICERLHKALYGKPHKDPMLKDLLDAALSAREQMVTAIQKSLDGILVKM